MERKESLKHALSYLVSLTLFYTSYWVFSVFSRLNSSPVSLSTSTNLLEMFAIGATFVSGVIALPPTRGFLKRKTGFEVPFWAVLLTSLVIGVLAVYINLQAVAEAAKVYASLASP